MSAHTPSPLPAAPPRPAGAGARLPWWAIALPVLAFVVLALVAEPARAQSVEGPSALAEILEHLRRLLSV
ncbi:hypothetical protein ACWDR0_29055 [Streptomyces sp. NPDC003691]